jgi:hypothetical protein
MRNHTENAMDDIPTEAHHSMPASNGWIRTRKPPPHDKQDWVKIHVFLRRNADGVVRIYETDGLLDDDDATFHDYVWEEGSFSCDCNRYLFFQRAAQEPEADDRPCGDSEYTVWIVNPANGATVYDEREASDRDDRSDVLDANP